MPKKFIVIGASAASVSFMTKLRSFDQESLIICFSGESYLPYNRCFLADFLTHEKSMQDLELKPEHFFKENKIDLRLQSWVTQINKEEKYVVVDGKREPYDYLFIGIGTKAFVPPIKGIDLQGVFMFHTLADINQIDHFIQKHSPSSALVIGAGINGIEAVSALVDRHIKVTLVDSLQSIMPLHVESDVALFIEDRMIQAGVTVVKGQKVINLLSSDQQHVTQVMLENGDVIAANCVIFATGNRLHSDLIIQTGLVTLNGSLQVNSSMQSSDPFIFAGGDICAAIDMVSKEYVRSATWSDAMLQGLIAATQFSDKPRIYPGVVGMRDSYFFGLDFYACGKTIQLGDCKVITRFGQDFAHFFYITDDLLQGFVLIGRVEKLATYRTLYLTQQAVSIELFE
ncbi:MAG: NAD(P)/FAD-dependent oxidoreductase [Candidatus Chromulinivorax sp.]